jgi:Ca2+-binding RTX toxin-like protein
MAYIIGTDQDDGLYGTEGSDVIVGGDGIDLIVGGLTASDRRDVLIGGADQDVFYFSSMPGLGNVDIIADFEPSNRTTGIDGDTIAVDASLFPTALGHGTLAEDAFCKGTEAQDRQDRILYDRPTGTVYVDADGSRGQFDPVKLCILSTRPKIDHDEFQF